MEDSTEWPNTGEMNKWYLDLYRFMAILKDTTPGWWVNDSVLKYLNIRMDTRNGNFRLYGEGQVQVSPDRVLAAIEKWVKV